MISDDQLKTWSNTGALEKSERTYSHIQNIITNNYDKSELDNKKLDIFLQGSYANHTNIRENSDIDVVVMLKDVWHADISKLSYFDKEVYNNNTGQSSIGAVDLKNTLKTIFLNKSIPIKEGNKCLKLTLPDHYLNVDIVPCIEYRVYKKCSKDYPHNPNNFIEGICITDLSGNKVINYPKLHKQNGGEKNQDVIGKNYKQIVRIFKNVNYKILEPQNQNVPSYFIECLLSNVPDSNFKSDLTTTFYNCITWLHDLDSKDISNLKSQNGITQLIGNSYKDSTVWDAEDCKNFINNIYNQVTKKV
ncbi:nucleotidyltransferase [Methanococcus voltae]|uniref:protein adenylyltransferase n=1 Tax=Methanococcus voltae (strain ATCC BAA-1334 / A3) TaxID=456320 RepID=D7DSL9_METV3|nr:nucleotidyltransferase [Methanococcus voltae]MCS3901728.1 hypothetical protein [Methanococcus voltae]